MAELTAEFAEAEWQHYLHAERIAHLASWQVAAGTGVSRPVVGEYLRCFAASGLTHARVIELSGSDLETYIQSPKPRHDGRYKQFRHRVDWYLTELGGKGVIRQLLWQEYRREVPDGTATHSSAFICRCMRKPTRSCRCI